LESKFLDSKCLCCSFFDEEKGNKDYALKEQKLQQKRGKTFILNNTSKDNTNMQKKYE
jgi:hypothetical protein